MPGAGFVAFNARKPESKKNASEVSTDGGGSETRLRCCALVLIAIIRTTKTARRSMRNCTIAHMPTRINGIGTGYYGRTNVSARHGRCELCNRDATLTSYDTREWFSVFFIPLIPMTKYRIMEQCSSCRRHRRLEQEQFQQQLNEHLEPLRAAIRSNPSDAVAHEKLILALSGFRMLDQAETAGRAAVAALPQNAILNRTTGDILWMKGDLGGAAAFRRRATNIDPADRGARTSLGSVLYYERNFAEAARQLEEARRLAPDDRSVIYTLGECYVQLERWPEALAAFQALGGSD
jgi:hypothetical protein